MDEQALSVQAQAKTAHAECSALFPARTLAKAIQGYREHGSDRKAAEFCGVTHTTLQRWRKRSPRFAALVDEAIDEHARNLGQKAVSALEKHLDDYNEGARVSRDALTRDGEVRQLTEPVELNPRVLQLALTRHDKRFVNTREEDKRGDTISVSDLFRAVMEHSDAARERWGDGAIDVTPRAAPNVLPSSANEREREAIDAAALPPSVVLDAPVRARDE